MLCFKQKKSITILYQFTSQTKVYHDENSASSVSTI